VLLTGAGGQLGRAVQRAFSRHEVVGRTHAELDVADAAAVGAALDAQRPELLLNAAAYNAVDAAEDDPAAAFRANAEGPRSLALATVERGVALLHVSTDYVFDGAKAAPYDERDLPNPLSVYGRSKLAGEEAVRGANPRHYVVRTAWLYGPHGPNFALALRAAAARQPELRVVEDQWGSPTYAPHLAAALEALIDSGAFGTHHLAGSGVASRFEWAEALCQALAIATPLRAIASRDWPARAARPRHSALTSVRETGIALPPWREGVRALAAALRS
jgi:dTDP-4-dehydrorhamnose reductase